MPTLPKISPELLQAYQDEINKTSSPATAKRKNISLNRFFGWAKDNGHLEENPLSQDKPEMVVTTPKKKTSSLANFAKFGMLAGLVILVFAFTNKLQLPIPFVFTPAKEGIPESKIQTRNQNEVNSPTTSETSPDGNPNTAISAGNEPWNLYADLKLDSPRVLSFKLYKTDDDNEVLWTSEPVEVKPDSDGSALISLDQVPTNLFFENNTLSLGIESEGREILERIPVSTANTPVIGGDGNLILAGASPAVRGSNGDLLIEGNTITVKTTDGGDGNIEVNPDGKGIVHFLFEGTGQNFLNAQGPNLTSGSLYYGIVANNSTGYDLLRLQSGTKATTKFAVDALGNTNIAGKLTVNNNVNIINGGGLQIAGVTRLTNLGRLASITGYYQDSGLFEIDQGVPDYAKITKTLSTATGASLADVLTLKLDESTLTTGSGSDTLVLNRLGGTIDGLALLVDEGNARFDGQLQLGRFSTNPTSIGQGSLVFNTGDNQIYVWDGSAWVPVGSGSTTSFTNISSGTNTTATMVVGTGASLTFSGGGTITASALSCADCLNFTEFADSMTLDAATDIATAGLTLSTSGTGALNFGSTGQVTLAGNVDATNGLDVTVANLTVGGANFTVVPGSGDITTAGDIAINGGDITSSASTFNFLDNTTSKTIDIGGVTSSAIDTINIATNATAADAISIGNINAATTLGLSGGTVTISTDSTGNGEVILPNDSIGPNEVFTTGQTDEYCITYEATGATWEWQTCGGGTMSWDSLTDPAGDLTLSMAAFNTTFNWDPGANTTETNFSLTTQGEDTVGSDEDQVLLALSQTSNGVDVTEAADALLTLTNNDANDPVNNGIRFDAGAANAPDFDTGINFDAADFTTEIVLENAETISNQVDGTIALGATTLSITAGGSIIPATAGALTIGDSSTTTLTLTTDGTGNGELVLPLDSVGPTEVEDNGATPTDEYCLAYESTGGIFEWQSCLAVGAGVAWNTITDPTGDLTLSMTTFNTTFNWDPGANAAETNFTLTTQGEDTVGGGDEDQVLLALSQTSNGADVDEAADALLTLANNDPNDPVNSAIRFDAGAAGVDFTYGINFDLADIGTFELLLENSESIDNQTDGTITFGRNDSGIVTLTARDDDTTAALTILPGGAAALILGGASTTSITLTTDGTGNAEVVLPNDSIGPNEVFTTGQTDEYCLTYEGTGTTWEWQTCGAPFWSSLTDPIADLTLTMAAFNTTFNWDPGADSAETNFVMTTQGEDTVGGGDEDQVLLALSQSSNGADVDEAADALLTLANNDANDPVNSAIRFDAGAAGTDFTYGINFDLADIGTAEIVLENAEAIHNQTNGTVTIEDDAGNDMALFIDQGTTGRLAISDSLQVGSLTTTTYSRFGTATTGHGLTTTDDVLISADLELNGILYLDGSTIANSAGTGTIILSVAPTTTANTLSAGNWQIENTANVGQSALMINQLMAGDLIAASASGTTRFLVANNGTVTITTTNAATVASLVINDSSGTGTGKIDVGTVDPPYTINGKKYATFLSGIIGVKEEVVGKAETNEYVAGIGYRYVIDFNNLPEGSDLWLFGKTTNMKANIGRLVALLTPSESTRVWYEVDEENKKLAIYSARPTKVSYRLTGPRFDADSWSNTRDPNSEVAGFILNNPDVANNNPIATTIQNLSDFVLENVQGGFYQLKDSGGQVIDGVESIGSFIAANIKSGAIETQELATHSLTAVQGTIDNLLITNGLVSPTISTNLISPLGSETDINIKIGNENGDTGKLSIKDETSVEVAAIDSQGNATFSGEINAGGDVYAKNIHADNLDEIEALLHEVEENQNLLAEAQNWDVNTATDSASLSNIVTSNLYVTNQAAINSLSISESLTVGSDLVISEGALDTLSAPLKLQSLAMAPVEIMAGKIKIATNGDVTIEGSVSIAGDLNVQGEIATPSLSTENLVIAGPSEETPGEIVPGDIETNTSIGKGIIPAGLDQIVVTNPKVNDYALVYVTPTSTTGNKVLYIKSKGAGFFTVGFSEPLETDVSFNWWIVATE